MSDQQNAQLTRRFIDACNRQQFDELDNLFVEDYVHHDPNLPPNARHGRENYKQGIAMFYSSFPDLQGTIEDLISDGDKVVARLRWTGTHHGELMGIPASGKPIDFGMIEIQRIAGGKIAEGWAMFDVTTMMQQIGAMPSPG